MASFFRRPATWQPPSRLRRFLPAGAEGAKRNRRALSTESRGGVRGEGAKVGASLARRRRRSWRNYRPSHLATQARLLAAGLAGVARLAIYTACVCAPALRPNLEERQGSAGFFLLLHLIRYGGGVYT